MNLNEFCEAVQGTGVKALRGDDDTVWVTHERFSMLRLPACALDVPSKEEISRIFRASHALMLGYAIAPASDRPSNAVLYVCRDPEYSLDKLSKNARYDIRRGLKEFDVRFIEQSEVLKLGEQAYCETLVRTGLSQAHREPFAMLFSGAHPERSYLGAMREGRLAAFLQLVEVNDWVSLGGYSVDEFLPLCPNNALVFYATHYFLGEKKLRVVDYGHSSIQASSKAEGLHKFKVKMGFEPIPVRRIFTFNPLFRPLANRISVAVLNRMLKFWPRHAVLKKAEGALRMAVETYDR